MRLSQWQSWFSRRYGLRVFLASWCWLAWCSVAYAESPRILLVRAPDVSNELAQSAAEDLAGAGQIIDPRGYLTAAQKQHIEPTSDAALTSLGPQVGALLLVSLDAEHGKLQVTYRDGKTGAVLTKQNLPLHGKPPKLPSQAAHKLSSTAHHLLAKLSKQHSGAAAVSATPEPPPSELEPEPTPPPPAAAAAQAAQTSPDQPDDAQAATDEAATAAPADASNSSEVVTGRASLGGGGAMRSVRVPTREGGAEVDTGFHVPAFEAALEAQLMLGSQWLLSAEVEYRGVFGAGVTQQQLNGATSEATVTSHSLVAGVAAGYRFGERGSPDLRLLLAWTFRGLYPSVDTVPGGSIQGPLLRPELRLPFANGLFTLRLAPELILVIVSNATLAFVAPGLEQVGYGFGGEAELDVRLSDAVQLGVEYRESHVSIASGWGNSYLDMERYAMLRVIFLF
jgi:hypothetical protein